MSEAPQRARPVLLEAFTALFVTVLILSMIMAQKLFTVFGITFTTAIIVFPVSYIIGDVMTEVYGYGVTRRVIWLGFVSNIIIVLFLEISVVLPPAAGWPNEQAYETVLHQIPRTVFASLTAYICGEFVNSAVLAKMKILTQGRYLWTRTIGSTVAGQAVDTVIFVFVAFVGIMPLSVIIEITLSAYIFKVVYETAATPLTYIVVYWVKKIERMDVFDTHTNFTPFRFERTD